MVYYKLILDERRFKEDQIYPIIVRITHNRKNSSLATGIRYVRTIGILFHIKLNVLRQTINILIQA
ncbi:MAG: Phage integrase family protein [Mucilaginibacter sp.]|nr:Phage integrase family protein [Mucilaginibacter sp.]